MPNRSRSWPAKPPRGAIGRPLAAALALALVATAGGCSWVPDEMNPARWFRSDEVKASGPTSSSEEFPNLATVPDQPRPASSPEELRRAQEGLIADREKAAYTDEALRNHPGEEVDFSTASKAPPAEVRRPVSSDASADVAAAEETAARASEQAAAATEPAVTIETPAPVAETTVEPVPPPPDPSVTSSEAAVSPEPTQETTAMVGSPDTIDAPAPPPATEGEVTVAAPAAEEPAGAAIEGGPSFVMFNERSTVLDATAEDTLRRFAETAAQRPGGVRILTWVGDADAADGAALAEKRAVAVAETLIALGVESQRVSALVMKGPEPGSVGIVPPSGRASITLQD